MFILSSVFCAIHALYLVVIFLGSDATPLPMSSSSLFHLCFNGELGDRNIWLNVLAVQWGVLAPWGVFSIITATPVPLAHAPSFLAQTKKKN